MADQRIEVAATPGPQQEASPCSTLVSFSGGAGGIGIVVPMAAWHGQPP
jgi:hypothetical protein